MAKFGEYHLNSVLFKIDQYLYYDAFLEGDNNKYIIKCIKKSDQWDDDVAQLEHEYNLLLSLNEKFQHFPKVFEFVDLEKHSGRPRYFVYSQANHHMLDVECRFPFFFRRV